MTLQQVTRTDAGTYEIVNSEVIDTYNVGFLGREIERHELAGWDGYTHAVHLERVDDDTEVYGWFFVVAE